MTLELHPIRFLIRLYDTHTKYTYTNSSDTHVGEYGWHHDSMAPDVSSRWHVPDPYDQTCKTRRMTHDAWRMAQICLNVEVVYYNTTTSPQDHDRHIQTIYTQCRISIPCQSRGLTIPTLCGPNGRILNLCGKEAEVHIQDTKQKRKLKANANSNANANANSNHFLLTGKEMI